MQKVKYFGFSLFVFGDTNFRGTALSQAQYLDMMCQKMSRSPFEIAAAWENDLDDSDCLMLDDLDMFNQQIIHLFA